MSFRFQVYNLRVSKFNTIEDDLDKYLSWKLFKGMHNPRHAQVKVFTCLSWKRTSGATPPYDIERLGYNIPWETYLGDFDLWFGKDGKEVLEKIQTEFSKGEAVRLFIFDSDSALLWQEVLVAIEQEGNKM